MKFNLHIPVATYAFLELHGDGEDDLAKAKEQYNLFAEKPISWPSADLGGFKEIETFTGEKVLYNDSKHEYRDLEGNHLVSGSEYKKSLEKPFDKAMLLPKTALAYGVSESDLDDMWDRNSKISTNFGTALHLAMEQWFKHKEHGTIKEYHLPKHPILLNAVKTFPEKDSLVKAELMVSDVKNKRVGQIDALQLLDHVGREDGTVAKIANIIDYKSDAQIKKNVKGHFNQLSFYAQILIAHGWTINKLVLWNYSEDGKWELYESEVLPLV